MTCSFEYNSNTYVYYVDAVTVTPRASGRQERLISGDLDTDLDDIEFLITIAGVWEQSTASSKSANQLWLDALGGAEMTFKSDDEVSTSYTVVADLNHTPTFVQTQKGVYMESVELRFFSKAVYQETDSVATGVAGMRPHYQY